MRLTFHQLNVFRTVVEHKSVSGAAQQLHMTQPAISNILKQLDGYFATKLLEMKGRNFRLSSAGKIVYAKSIEVVDVLSTIKEDVDALSGQLSGELCVSVVSTAKYFMPRLLAAFRKDFPQIDLKLKVCNRHEIIERLKQNKDDFVVMSQPPQLQSIDIKPFYEDQLVVAGANAFVQNKKELALRSLQRENWLIRERGSGTRMMMEKLFKQHGMQANVVMEVGNNESIKQLLIANMGISVISLQSIELEVANNLIKPLSVQGFPLPHEWYIVSHKHRQHSRAVKEFMNFVQSHPDLVHFSSWQLEK